MVVLVDRYGDQIEYDLHGVGLDLLDFFRGVHPWGKLLRLLNQLPAGSAYWAARADDDDAIEELVASGHIDLDDGKASALPLTEMSTTNQLLVAVVDMLNVIAHRVELTGGVKPNPLRLMPRSSSAMSRAKDRAESRYVSDLVSEAYAAQTRSIT